MVRRGDIWLIALDPVRGSEIRKTRPFVVISPSEMLAHLRTAIVAPMTTAGTPAPFRIPLKFRGKMGLMLLDQIRAVDKARLVRRLGSLPESILHASLSVLQEMFAPGP